MPRPVATETDQRIESWEITTGGSVWVWIFDRREDRFKKQRVGGRSGSRLLHITRDDRKFNQEQVPVENKELDVFTNGSLRLISESDRDDSIDARHHLSNDELTGYFNDRDRASFKVAMQGITSELILRRLYSLVEDHGTVAQRDILRDLIAERYPVGGTQRTVQEMLDAGERIGAQRL
jgi:hypothetical protein